MSFSYYHVNRFVISIYIHFSSLSTQITYLCMETKGMNERKENRAKLVFCLVRRSYVEYSTEKKQKGERRKQEGKKTETMCSNQFAHFLVSWIKNGSHSGCQSNMAMHSLYSWKSNREKTLWSLPDSKKRCINIIKLERTHNNAIIRFDDQVNKKTTEMWSRREWKQIIP